MLKFIKKNNYQEDKLYNKILNLSRNKLFYAEFGLEDTLQNRIYLIFIHISFLIIKIKRKTNNSIYKNFSQKMFDITFRKIELNMRELGHGDMSVNKNMRFLVKIFYNILLNCENYEEKSTSDKNLFLYKHLTNNKNDKGSTKYDLSDYFDKYLAFCLDLRPDSVLKGDLNFNYK